MFVLSFRLLNCILVSFSVTRVYHVAVAQHLSQLLAPLPPLYPFPFPVAVGVRLISAIRLRCLFRDYVEFIHELQLILHLHIHHASSRD